MYIYIYIYIYIYTYIFPMCYYCSTMKKVCGQIGSSSRATYPKWKTLKARNTICIIGINYCIGRVRIENNSYKCFLHFLL